MSNYWITLRVPQAAAACAVGAATSMFVKDYIEQPKLTPMDRFTRTLVAGVVGGGGGALFALDPIGVTLAGGSSALVPMLIKGVENLKKKPLVWPHGTVLRPWGR